MLIPINIRFDRPNLLCRTLYVAIHVAFQAVYVCLCGKTLLYRMLKHDIQALNFLWYQMFIDWLLTVSWCISYYFTHIFIAFIEHLLVVVGIVFLFLFWYDKIKNVFVEEITFSNIAKCKLLCIAINIFGTFQYIRWAIVWKRIRGE